MAGFQKIYCVGGLGGYQGADGVNPIALQIWLGGNGRQWLEGHAFRPEVRRLGDVEKIIPASPDDPDALLDACIAFFAHRFEGCASFPAVRAQLAGVRELDFADAPGQIPAEWVELREEARPIFRGLNIFEAELRQIMPSGGTDLAEQRA